MADFVVKLGARARAHIERQGLAPADIACVAAAAGGPKGLALIPLDRWLFGSWFAGLSKGPTLVGASIGAWRLAAGAHSDPVAALGRLQEAYLEEQRYRPDPSPAEVSAACTAIVSAIFPAGWHPEPRFALRVLTARASGSLHQKSSRLAFARAVLANLWGRGALSRYLERIVFATGPCSALDTALMRADDFGLTTVPLHAGNARPALLASGSIPLVSDPVVDIPNAPGGWYWDGGLIDYHLFYPYRELPGLVLYPHFTPYLVPGWLDKHLRWRRQPVAGQSRLENLILIAPSAAFLRRLPNGKLPDRQDFKRYGQRHDARIRDWRIAIAACEEWSEQVAAWLRAPDLGIV
jgi:hypothetical protein